MTPEFSDSGVPKAVSDLLVSYYRDASTRLKSMVLKPTGLKQSSKEFRSARASALMVQVDEVLRGLKAKASGWVGKRMPAAYREGKIRADQQAREAGVRVAGSGLSGSFSQHDQRAVLILARDAAADLNKAADSMGDRAKSLLRKTAQVGLAESDINRILAGGVIEGTPVETIRSLREELRAVHGDTVTIIDKNGDPIEFNVGKYAEMVARTKTREATVQARHERLQELDLDLVSIVGRVSKTFCTAFLGRVFSLSGKSKKYPAYDSLESGGPPFHPHCTKSTRPFVEELAEPEQLAQAAMPADERKLVGMTASQAQRAYKDLQLYTQVRERYQDTEKKLFKGAA